MICKKYSFSLAPVKFTIFLKMKNGVFRDNIFVVSKFIENISYKVRAINNSTLYLVELCKF